MNVACDTVIVETDDWIISTTTKMWIVVLPQNVQLCLHVL